MTIDPSKLVGIPKMGAGEKLNAATELDKLCTPPRDLSKTIAHGSDPLQTLDGNTVKTEAPKPRLAKPDPAFYWADDYGNIWRQAVEPVVVLTVTSGCTIAELGVVLAALLGSR